MFTIENHLIRATINPKGAELTSLYHKSFDLDYLWNGDPAFWGKHSPVLFPIVGTLKDNTYLFEGKPYHLGRHGFARDTPFAVETQTFDSITFLLKEDEQLLQQYPFPFELRIRYVAVDDALTVTYTVNNTGKKDMYFSIGAHPAFRLPLAEGTAYNDYYIHFNQVETAGRWPIAGDGLIQTVPIPLLENTQQLPLKKELFFQDAIVLKNLQSTSLSIRANNTLHGIDVDFPGFPYLGIWAAKNADFVCIEPWCGIADSTDTTQEFTEKEGINKLAAGDTFTRTWSAKLL